jgi:hypothetical protein
MADARAAGEKDDARVLFIAEKIRALMNNLILPKVTHSSKPIEFKWGKQDSFQFDFTQLLEARSAGFVSSEEARQILRSVGWKLDDESYSKSGSQPKSADDKTGS